MTNDKISLSELRNECLESIDFGQNSKGDFDTRFDLREILALLDIAEAAMKLDVKKIRDLIDLPNGAVKIANSLTPLFIARSKVTP